MKRVLDMVAALIMIVLLSPVMVLVAIFVRLTVNKQVLFKQERSGLHMKPFYLYKFRTMSDARHPNGELLPDTDRMNKAGIFLRLSSLDELPQLFNVLKGDMSLVGPRPLPSKFNPYIYENERVRFHVRPGITGLAQIKGRNKLTWKVKFQADIEYVERKSMWLDLKILLKTVSLVLTAKDNAIDPTMFAQEIFNERPMSVKS